MKLLAIFGDLLLLLDFILVIWELKCTQKVLKITEMKAKIRHNLVIKYLKK